ncbi:MAG: T9SS type A sorting domain-containing protein [Salibacteraceae bacterium]
MIKHLVLILFLFMGPLLKAQYFNELYDFSGGSEYGLSVLEINGGYFVNSGGVNSSGFEGLNYLITDFQGIVRHKKSYAHSTKWVRSGKAILLLDNNIADIRTVGYSDSNGVIKCAVWFIKLNQLGDTLWSNEFMDSTVNCFAAQSIIQTSDSGFVLVCDKEVSVGNNNPVLIRTDKNGNELFRKEIKTFNVEVIYDIVNNFTGDYILSGTGNSLHPSYDPWIVKVDSTFNIIWAEYYPFGNGTAAKAIVLQDSNILFTSDSLYSSGSQLSSYRLTKIDQSGNLIWDKKHDKPRRFGSYRDLIELNDKSIVVFGQYFEGNYPFRTLTKVTAEGDTIWKNLYYYKTKEDDNYLWDFIQTTDKGFLLAGNVIPQGSATQDLWLLKVDSNGCNNPACDSRVYDIRVGIDYRPQINTEFKVFPNPVVSELNVVQQTTDETIWEYQLLNLNGQVLQSGEIGQTKTLDVSGLAKGSYVLQLQHGPVKKSYKVVK